MTPQHDQVKTEQRAELTDSSHASSVACNTLFCAWRNTAGCCRNWLKALKLWVIHEIMGDSISWQSGYLSVCRELNEIGMGRGVGKWRVTYLGSDLIASGQNDDLHCFIRRVVSYQVAVISYPLVRRVSYPWTEWWVIHWESDGLSIWWWVFFWGGRGSLGRVASYPFGELWVTVGQKRELIHNLKQRWWTSPFAE